MVKLFVVGSTNIDETIFIDQMPVAGETKYAKAFHTSIGGKGANQALAAKAFGLEVQFISKIGKDDYGKIETLLKDQGMSCDGLIVDEQVATGKAYIICENKDNRILLNAGANQTITFTEIKEKLEGQAGDILLMQLELPYDVTYQVIKFAKEKQMTVVLNPAPANKEVNRWLNDVDVLIINQSEADLLTGIYPTNLQEGQAVYDCLYQKGLNQCIITLGKQGSLYFSLNKAVHVETIQIDPLDTTGAGDTFIGGFIYGYQEGMPIEKQLRFANVAGSLACLTIGAQGAAPSINKIMEYL